MCRESRQRTHAFSKTAPTKWNPEQVINPQTCEVFTEDQAWDFIADLLEDECEIERIPLEKPPGKYGYVIRVDMGEGFSELYIKLQLGPKIIGRSFHYSTVKDW